MNFDGFTPHEFTRFGGLVDNDDPTVLPMGVAAVCRNCRFQLTTVATRYGLQTAMQGPNQAGISGLAGLIYTPENPGETLFQVPMVFDTDGFLLIEKPVGSGHLVRVQGPLVTQPTNAHAIMTEAYNRALIAYSDLKTPKAPINVYGLSTQQLDPYGQKPLGAAWLASTAYLVGEYVQPTATGGNGHLYRCTVAGATNATEPVWPLTENATVTDGGVTWQELTPVLVNRLPAPNSPQPLRVAGSGAFAAGRDVYLEMTYVNAQGESIASAPGILVHTNLHDAARFTVPAADPAWQDGFVGPGRSRLSAGIKPSMCTEADVPTGAEAALSSASFAQVGKGFRAPGRNRHGDHYNASGVTTAALVEHRQGHLFPADLPPPPTPTVERASGLGQLSRLPDEMFYRDRHLYQRSRRDACLRVAGMLSADTVADDAIQVPIPSTLYQITGVNLYEADVPTGSPAPASSSYALVGSFQPLTTAHHYRPRQWAEPQLPRPAAPGPAEQYRARRGHRPALCQHRLHQPQRKSEPHGRRRSPLHQRGCARRSTVHG